MCATADLLQLQSILEHEDIERLDARQISYLQLRYMERLKISEIAALLEHEPSEVERIARQLHPFTYQPSARSTI